MNSERSDIAIHYHTYTEQLTEYFIQKSKIGNTLIKSETGGMFQQQML